MTIPITSSRRWREAAHDLPPGPARDLCLDRATQIEYAARQPYSIQPWGRWACCLTFALSAVISLAGLWFAASALGGLLFGR